jgi:hypothetical protein
MSNLRVSTFVYKTNAYAYVTSSQVGVSCEMVTSRQRRGHVSRITDNVKRHYQETANEDITD